MENGRINAVFFFWADGKGKFDELVEEKGVKIIIDPKALMHVIGTKMDFVDDKLRYMFTFFFSFLFFSWVFTCIIRW